MIYKVADIMQEVRVAIDKNNNSAPLAELGDVDTLSIDEIIERKLEDAARVVISNAPHHLLDSGKAFATSISWNSSKVKNWGFTQLPDDFLRLVSFQMCDWSYPVTEPITEEHPLYAEQQSRFVGIGGNYERPVVAIVQYPIGLVLEFYSCTANNVAVKRARYIGIPHIENGNINICEKLKQAVVYYCAYMVDLTLSNIEHANAMLALYRDILGIRLEQQS